VTAIESVRVVLLVVCDQRPPSRWPKLVTQVQEKAVGVARIFRYLDHFLAEFIGGWPRGFERWGASEQQEFGSKRQERFARKGQPVANGMPEIGLAGSLQICWPP